MSKMDKKDLMIYFFLILLISLYSLIGSIAFVYVLVVCSCYDLKKCNERIEIYEK